MSKYTTEVRFLCESEAGLTESRGFNSIDSILQESAPKIFNFDFPIFDENYRLPLEIKILRYYYTREICEETVGLWKLRLQNKLNLIMPYYNQLYKSELIKFNPLYDTDLTTDHTLENEHSEETETSGNENGNATTNYNETVVTDTDTTNNIDKQTTNQNIVGKSERITNNDVETIDDLTKETTDEHTTTTPTGTNVTQTTLDEHTTTTPTGTKVTVNTETPGVTITKDGWNKNDEDNTNRSWDLYSDTPQGGVVGLTEAWDSIAGNAYLTNARRKVDEGNIDAQSSFHDTTVPTGNNQSRTEETPNVVTTVDITGRPKVEETPGVITVVDTVGVPQTKFDRTTNINKEQNLRNDEQADNTGTENVSETGTIDTTVNKTGRNVTDTTKDFTTNGTSNITGLENYIQHVVGKSAGKSYSAMLNEFRETFLNIDRMIINDLSNLFFGLW